MAKRAKETAKEKKPRAAKKTAPKASPRSVTKAAEKLEGPRPLSVQDYEFCKQFVITGKQVDAFRSIMPDAKDPHGGAFRMMQRPEIREHIREIYRQISKHREKAAEVAARASLLTLELADDRLTEILQQPRKTRGEMLSKDVKELLIPGATMVVDEDGNSNGYSLSPEAKKLLGEGAPAEDADLLKAIKLAYERRGGIIKHEKAPETGPVIQMLYKPKWYGTRAGQTIEASQ